MYVSADFHAKIQSLLKNKQIFARFVRPMFVVPEMSLRSKELSEVTNKSLTVERFEEKLRQQQRILERSMLSTVEQGRQAVAADTQDVADQAVMSYQKELIYSQGSKGHSQLSHVRLALERIREGTFGECLQCSNTIGPKRLEALPWTPYCIDCQEKVERGEIQGVVRAA
jgi:DnaK suppressor protein